MNIKAYLNRINYTGDASPTLETLKQLHHRHYYHVPFENLDIHMNVPIQLNIFSIEEKVIKNNRGGFCYELNGLFYELLKALGFQVIRISARVYSESKGYGPEYDHLAMIVTINNQEYLADVGFGEFIDQPLRIDLDSIQQDERGTFKIEKHTDSYLRVSKKGEKQWSPEYIFSKQHRTFDEFSEMCLYHQTSPESHFTEKRICTLPIANGRITISKNTLKTTQQGNFTEEAFEDDKAYKEALKQYFKIAI